MLKVDVHHNFGHDTLNIPSENSLKKVLDGYDFYLAKYEVEDKTIVITDHVCSIPGFYTLNGDVFINWEIDAIDCPINNNEIKKLYNCSGFSLASNTLNKSIKTFLPNKRYEISSSKTSITNIENDDFFEYQATENPNAIELIDDKFQEIIKVIVSRLPLNEKILIPLSGGYDSRIIAYYLSKFVSKERIIAFTYGQKDNKEAQKSEYVAKSLGIKWVFVEYTDKLISKHRLSFEEYMSSNLRIRSLLHFQDFFAVKQLIEDKYISDNTVVMPGHSGDFLFGSHVKSFKDISLSDIVKKHFRECDISDRKKEQIKSTLSEEYEINTLKAFLYFNLNERQSKYIINSVRTYEYFGLKWSIPFWHKDLVRLANILACSQLKERRFQKKWINLATQQHIFEQDNPTEYIRFGRLKKVVVKFPVISRVLLRVLRVVDVSSHFLNFHKLLSFREKLMVVILGLTIKGAMIRKNSK